MTTHANGPDQQPQILSDNCTGPNPACRKAHRQGRPVHVIPSYTPHGSVVMPTYHYATAEDGIRAVADAIANAPVVATDDDLYRYRAQGVAYRLPTHWIDPTRR